MMRIFFFLVFMSLIVACGNSDENSPYSDLYRQPAYSAISDSIHDHPGRADLHMRRADLFLKNGNPEPALFDYRMAWQIDPAEEHAVAVGNLLLDKNADSARIFLLNAMQQHSKSYFLRLQLARAYGLLDSTEKELEILNQILADAPGQIDAILLKATLLEEMGKFEEAEEALEQAHSIAPFDAELAFRLAYRYAENKNIRAIALSDSLIRADSSGIHAAPYYFKALYYENTGSQNEALKLYDQAILHDYNFLDAFIDKGDLLLKMKRYQEALNVFERAQALAPGEGYVYYGLARAQEALGKTEDALLNFRRAAGLDKSLTEASAAAERLAREFRKQ